MEMDQVEVININTATETNLCTLPGISDIQAKKTIEARNAYPTYGATAILDAKRLDADHLDAWRIPTYRAIEGAT